MTNSNLCSLVGKVQMKDHLLPTQPENLQCVGESSVVLFVFFLPSGAHNLQQGALRQRETGSLALPGIPLALLSGFLSASDLPCFSCFPSPAGCLIVWFPLILDLWFPF